MAADSIEMVADDLFFPEGPRWRADEAKLYFQVSEFLKRKDTVSYGDRTNQLVILQVRKILGSSTFAVSRYLEKLIVRLESKTPVDETVTDTAPVGETLGGDLLDHAGIGVADLLHMHCLGISHGAADRAEHADCRLRDAGLCRESRCDIGGHGVVGLPNVGERVLTRRGFEAHGAIGRDEPAKAVAPANLAVVSGFCGSPGEREVSAVLLICLVDLHGNSPAEVLGSDLCNLSANDIEDGVVLGTVLDPASQNRAGNGDVDGTVDPGAHDLYVATDRVQTAEFVAVEPPLHLVDGLLYCGTGRGNSGERGVVGQRDGSGQV